MSDEQDNAHMSKRLASFVGRLRLYSSLFLIGLLCLSLQACHNNTPPPGLTYGSPERLDRVGMRDVLLNISLVSHTGQAIGNVGIFAEAPKETDRDTTNIDGKAVINIGLREDDSIEFHFRSAEPSATQNIDWTTTVNGLPKEESQLKLIFTADKLGKISLTALEY
jgi:hypothetical protein